MVGAFQSPSRLVKHCSNPEELLVGWCRASLLLKIAVAKQLHFGLLLQSKAVSGSCFPDLQVQGTVCYMISSTAGIRTCSLPGTCTGRSLKHGTVAKFGFWEKQCISLSLSYFWNFLAESLGAAEKDSHYLQPFSFLFLTKCLHDCRKLVL